MRTPVKLLMTEGTKAANQITIIFAASPMPSHKIASGIQVSGGIGLMNRNTGLMKASARRFHPINRPSGNSRSRGHEEPYDHQLQAVQNMLIQQSVSLTNKCHLMECEPDVERGRKAAGRNKRQRHRCEIPERNESRHGGQADCEALAH